MHLKVHSRYLIEHTNTINKLKQGIKKSLVLVKKVPPKKEEEKSLKKNLIFI